MYSTFHEYGYIKTTNVTETFSTKIVEEFISQLKDIRSEGNGAFSSIDDSFSMQIMLVKNFDSWNSDDYNSEKANYLSFVISRDKIDEYRDLINKLSDLLNIPFQAEEE